MTGFWAYASNKRIFPSRQDGVSVTIEGITGGTDLAVGLRTRTMNTETLALLTVDELAVMCEALDEILADCTSSLQNIDPRPHLEELDEIDAQL